MAKVDFITLANIIFKDKDKFKFISDEEKESNFFMLNRKFAIKYIKQAQFFNNKNINRPSSIDVWYQIFYNIKGTPAWWWQSKQPAKAKVKSEFNSTDLKLVKEYYSITDKDIDFLIKYYSEKLKEDIKRLKKFKNE